MDEDATRAALQTSGLLHTGEWEAMVAGDRHTIVYGWIQSAAVQLSRRGLISQHELGLVAQAVGRARAGAGDLMGTLGRDLPYPYASFVSLLVKFHMLVHALARGFVLSSYTQRGAQAYLLGLLLCNLTFLQAIVHHHRLLHNPFGDQRLALPHRSRVDGLHALRDAVMAGSSFTPPPSPADSSTR